ncbi:hypothetical protein P5V15_007658 [Pogonomyrmex californicus]
MVLLGEIFPDFIADTQMGTIRFHEWLDNSWGILFSHPNDFTPVCTTELAQVMKLMPEFNRLGVKVIALSCNSIESHVKWIEDIKSYAGLTGQEFPYPIIEDKSRKLITLLGMLDPAERDQETGLPMSARAVYIIDPNKKMRLSILYPATTGRNFDEILRTIESLQLTEKYKVATPVNWKKGDDVMIDPSVSDEEAKKCYSDINTIYVPSGKTYMRLVPQPTDT